MYISLNLIKIQEQICCKLYFSNITKSTISNVIISKTLTNRILKKYSYYRAYILLQTLPLKQSSLIQLANIHYEDTRTLLKIKTIFVQ